MAAAAQLDPPAPETGETPSPAESPAAAPESERWDQIAWLPCRIEVQLTVPGLSVGDILRLEPQSVVETRWQQNADVPIRVNGQLIAWAEFEGLDEKLAVRVTRLA